MRISAVILIAVFAVACAGQPTPTASPTLTLEPATGTPVPTNGSTIAPTDQPSSESTPEITPESSSGPTSEPEPTTAAATMPPVAAYAYQEWDVPAGAHPHDVAPHPDGSVWYTGQHNGTAGRLDPATGEVTEVDLPAGAAPHGVIVDQDGSIWITDQGLNAVLRIDPETHAIETYGMSDGVNASPHTPTVAQDETIWFTGANGFVGRVNPTAEERTADLYEAPEGQGPYGIDMTPSDEVWFVSLGQSYLGLVDKETGETSLFEPPTPNQGARRVWSDSTNRLWLTEWNAGKLAMYDPARAEWREWEMPGDNPMPYAIYVDELDLVWITDFGSNAIVRFDPTTEIFDSFPMPTPNAEVRQLFGRPGELWGAESGTNKIVVLRW